MAMTEKEEYREEIEQMAEQRVKIEDAIQERESELAQLGEFDSAICTGFEWDDERYRGNSNVVFIFTFPDGSTTKKSYDVESESRSLKRFMNRHGADSVTDMVGAKLPAIYTNSGWQSVIRRAERFKWGYYTYSFQDGSLLGLFYPPILVAVLLFIAAAFTPYSFWVGFVAPAAVLTIAAYMSFLDTAGR